MSIVIKMNKEEVEEFLIQLWISWSETGKKIWIGQKTQKSSKKYSNSALIKKGST